MKDNKIIMNQNESKNTLLNDIQIIMKTLRSIVMQNKKKMENKKKKNFPLKVW